MYSMFKERFHCESVLITAIDGLGSSTKNTNEIQDQI